MQLFSRNKTLSVLSLGALAALGACGDDVTVPAPVAPPVVISITPPSSLLNVGESVSFAVQISGGNPAPTLASCTSSNTAVATAAVNAGACRVTAVAAGNATVTAASSTGQSAAASVTVSAPAAAITGLTVTPTTSQIGVGQTVTLTPTVQRAATAVTVASQFTSSSPNVATVSATGVVTALAPGATTITVSVTGTGAGFTSATLTSAATVTVVALPAGITSLNVQPTSLVVALGGTAQISAAAQQPTGAAAAGITYGTTAPTVATVSNTGLVTALTPGSAVITVTATSAANTQFGASTLTQLVPVTVTPSATVTIQTITQGPVTTSYLSGNTGIASANNPQVNQPIDITNVRDQIQLVLNLQPNGQRVDSVVAFIANADGTARTAAARQLYSNGRANDGDITLFINTADFAVDFAAATPSANALYRNGQKIVSASVFTTTPAGVAQEAQIASNNRQTLNFNNLDGWAAQFVAPTRSATKITATSGSTTAANLTAANQTWWGGPGATGRGSYAVVPVIYTPGRSVSVFTTAILQGVRDAAGTAVCLTRRGGGTGRNAAQPESFGAAASTVTGARLTYDGTFGAGSAGGGFTSTAGNAAIECGDYELNATDAASGNLNFPGIVSAVDNSNNSFPIATVVNGFRFSASVPAPTGIRLDYVGPGARPVSGTNAATYTNISSIGGNILREPDLRRRVEQQYGVNSVTGWVNDAYDINANTAANTDNGVGLLAGAAAQRAVRSWFVFGCGVELASATSFNGTGAALNECASDFTGGYDNAATATQDLSLTTRGPYQVFYTEPDLLGNVSSSDVNGRINNASGFVSARFGVDKTAPTIRWTAATNTNLPADTNIVTAANVASALQAEFYDERAGFVETTDNGNAIVLSDAIVGGATLTTVNTASTINSTTSASLGGGTAISTYRAQQHFMSQAAGYLTAADFPTRARCLYATNAVTDANIATRRQTSWVGYTAGDGNTFRATGAAIVTAPTCFFANADVLQGAAGGDGFRPGMAVSLPAEGMFRYSTRVADRAGNVSTVLTKWAAIDANATNPNANLNAPLSVAQGGAASFLLSYEDRSEVRGNNISVAYPGLTLVYPKQLLDGRFNDVINAPSSANISTPNGAPFISAISATLAAAPDKATAASATVFDVVNNSFTTNASILGTGLADPTSWNTWIGTNTSRAFTSFGVLTTLNAGFNAGVGLKAQVVAPSNAVNSPFVRVEFFRLTGGQQQYLGASTTAISGDNGGNRTWTYLLTTYANTPTALQTVQTAAQPGDQIIAVGVRSTGEGLVTGASTIGGTAITLSVAGLPGGANASIRIQGSGYDQTFTAGSFIVLPAGGAYTVTVNNVFAGSPSAQYTGAFATGGGVTAAGNLISVPNGTTTGTLTVTYTVTP